MSDKLKNINGAYTGSRTINFHTVGTVGKDNDWNKYFSNFSFCGPRYGNKFVVSEPRAVYDSIDMQHWDNAFEIDPNNYQLVVDTIDMFSRKSSNGNRGGEKDKLRLFNVSINIKITEVNTDVDEFLEIKKYNAIKKLSVEEIQYLGIEDQAVYLKLKYGGEQPDQDSILF